MRKSLHYSDQAESIREIDSGIAHFQQDFSSKIWLTYRKNFPYFKGSKYNSDCGWGCMIRCGQMLVANAILTLHLGRNWRWNFSDFNGVFVAEDLQREILHRNVIRIFADNYSSPLSIHNLMEIAKETFDKKPGDWFGPNSTAHILSKALGKNEKNHEMLKNLKCYVAKDGTIYKEDIYKMCRTKKAVKTCPSYDSIINFDEYSIIDPNEIRELNEKILLTSCEKILVENEENLSPGKSRFLRNRSLSVPSLSSNSNWSPILIFIPVKLGQDSRLNPIYKNCLKSFLATETCVGIMGGKPKHSLYFIGFQDDNLIHLDPHLSQENVDISLEEFDVESFHSKSPRKLPINKMDPSCCLGFLLESENQFEGWCELASELARPLSDGTSLSNYPLFTINQGRSELFESNLPEDSEVLNQIQQLDSIDEAGIDANSLIPPTDEDEFVFIF